jgi:P22 coat protein - gene protein 5
MPTVDQSKLVLNTFSAIFQNNLVCADVATWKQNDSELNDRNRLTYSEQVGPRFNVTETVDGVADLTSGVQDSVFGSEQFIVNRTFGSSMGWGDFVKIRDIGDARESEAIKNAATQLAEKIDAYVLRVAGLASNNWVTTNPANGISDLGDVASGYTRLKQEGVDDADLRAILAWEDRQSLSETIVAYPATDNLSTSNFRGGFDGTVNGIPTMFTQQLAPLTTGTRTNAAVNGANQNVNYRAVALSPAPGQYLTQLININGVGANATIKAGEVFTIAGAVAFDNRLGASLGRLQQFTVVSDATADGTGAVTGLRIFPAIVVPGSGTGLDINVNTAHATVVAAPATAAVITWVGTASTTYRPRFIIQKGAIRVNTAPLIMPATGEAMKKSLTKVPLSVRMWKNSTFATGNHEVRFDVALSANIVDRRRIVRINQS